MDEALCLCLAAFSKDDYNLLVSKATTKISHELSRLCRLRDPFWTSLSHRIHVLYSINAAMTRHRVAEVTRMKTANQQKVGETKVVGPAVLTSGGQMNCPEGRAEDRYSNNAHLGLQLFFCLFDFVKDPGCREEQLGDFLQQIAPVLSSLSPLSLACETSMAQNKPEVVGGHEASIHPPLGAGVVNTLREFLYTASLHGDNPSLGKDASHGRKQRATAISSLIYLAAARGRASDLLVLVKVLLCLDLPMVSPNILEDDKIAHVPTVTETKKSPPLPTECTMKRRPQSRVKGKSILHEGVPIDVEGGSWEALECTLLNAPAVEEDPADQIVVTDKGLQAWKKGQGSIPNEDFVMSEQPNLGKGRKGSKEWQLKTPMPKGKPPRTSCPGSRSCGGSGAGHRSRPPSASEPVQEAEPQSVGPFPQSLEPVEILPLLRQLHNAQAGGDMGPGGKSTYQHREVWTCGQNSYGELAHSDTVTRKDHCMVKVLEGKEVVDVAAGNEHTVILCRSGEIFTAGYNDNGQCGQGNTQRIGILSQVKKLMGRRVVQVHAYNGCEHTLAVLEDGRVVSFGYNYRGQLGHGNTTSEPVPRPVRGLDGRRVQLVSCSYYHSIVACETGEVYTFGRNDFGQLGTGDTIDRKLPTLVNSLRDQRVVSLACGQYHSAVATKEGEMFTCGKNDYGQIGVESSNYHEHLVLVKGALEGERVVHLCCGYYHTITLVTGGHLFGFGRNDYGQLGLGHIAQRVLGPQLIVGVEGKGICCVAAGCYHTILIGSNGMLYVFGRNNHGQLGTGDTNERHTPYPIDTFLGKRVTKVVAAGFYHTIVLTGGADEDSTKQRNSKIARTLDPDVILGHPSLALPTGKDGVISSETTNEDTVSPEIDSPAGPNIPALEDMLHVGFSTDAEKESSSYEGLCLPDGRVTAGKAAVFILAHMDRLAGAFIPQSSAFPIIAPAEIRDLGGEEAQEGVVGKSQQGDCADSQGSCRDRHFYSIDPSPETFELLECFLSFFAESPSPTAEPVEGTGSFHPFLLLACLRILKANLTQLLRSPTGSSLRECMLALSVNLHLDANELQLEGCQGGDSGLNVLPFVAPELKQDSRGNRAGLDNRRTEAGEDGRVVRGGSSGDHHDEISRYRDVMCALQQCLLRLVQYPPWGTDMAAPVQEEAASVLILGLEVFYSSQVQQCQLLSKLINASTEDEDAPCRNWQGGGDSSSRALSPSVTRRFILNPLLRRLCDDALASKLIPYRTEGEGCSVCTTIETSEPALRRHNTAAVSARVLGMQVKLLVDQVATSKEYPHQVHHASAPVSNLPDRTLDQVKCGTASEPESKDTRHLFVDLILTLEKHMMHWAASDRVEVDPGLWISSVLGGGNTGSGCSPSRSTFGTPTTFAAQVKGLCDQAAAVMLDGVDRTPSSWRCLLEHAQLVFKHSIVILEAGGQDAGWGDREKSEGGHLVAFEGTLVESVLPALVNGLLPFAYLPAFGRRLLPVVTTTVKLLDSICRMCPTVCRADRNYVQSRNRSGELPKHKPQTLFRRGESGKLGSGGTSTSGAGIVDGGFSDASVGPLPEGQGLHWLLSLAKTTSVLAGRLACTLIVGNCGISPFLEAYFRCPAYAKWLESDIFSGGCDSLYEGLLLSPFDVVDDEFCTSLDLSFESIVQDSSSVAGATGCTPRREGTCNAVHREQQAKFLGDMVQGTGQGGWFCSWVCEYFSSYNIGYRAIKHQALAGPDGIPLERIERGVLAALLKHEGCGDIALSCAASHNDGRPSESNISSIPPRQFVRLWTTVAEVTSWLWHCRSKLRSAHAGQKEIDQVLGEAASCSVALLLLNPAPRFAPTVLGCSANSFPCSVARTTHRWWRKAILVVMAMVRWRGLSQARQSKTCQAVAQLVKEMVGRTVRLNYPKDSGHDFPEGTAETRDLQKGQRDSDPPGSILVLLVMMLDNHQRAIARASGFRALSTMVETVQTQSLLADLLVPLPTALRTPNLVDGHYRTHLEGVGNVVLKGVVRGFQVLHSHLLRKLRLLCQSIGEDYTLAPGDAFPVEETGKNESVVPTCFDAHAILIMLDSWGVIVRAEDWAFIEDVGAIEVVSFVAARLASIDPCKTDPNGENGQGDGNAIGGVTRGGSINSMSKVSERVVTLCHTAARTLMRLLIMQLSKVTPRCTLGSIFGVLHKEFTRPVLAAQERRQKGGRQEVGQVAARKKEGSRTATTSPTPNSQSILEFVAPGVGGISPVPERGTGQSGTGKLLSAVYSHKRRCQELICSPRRLMNMEDGLVFPAEQLLSNPKGCDFSITFWMLLAQDHTGQHRALLARGHKSERWPVVLLRDTDNRLEVCFSVPSMGNLFERLTSKESVPVNKWTHVGVVSEQNKLRLYFNGALDCQRSNTGVMRPNKHPLYVGKVPDGATHLDGVRGGFEGSIAHLRYYTRALSPIHVRIICDPGPPEIAKVEDEDCYLLCLCLVVMSRSAECRRHLVEPRWLCICFQAFIYGTTRVQQAIARLFREVLPHTKPEVMACLPMRVGQACTPSPAIEQERAHGATAITDKRQTTFVLYLLQLIGASSWSIETAPEIMDSYTKRKDTDGDETASFTLRDLISRQKVARALPSIFTVGSDKRAANAAVATTFARKTKSTGNEGHTVVGTNATVGLPPTSLLSSDVVHDLNTLGAELVSLVRTLSGTKAWAGVVSQALKSELRRLAGFVHGIGKFCAPGLESGDRIDNGGSETEESLSVGSGEAALQVLGGHIELVRVGASAEVKGKGRACTVLSFNQPTSVAHIIMHRFTGEKTKLKPQRLTAEDLTVESMDSSTHHAWEAMHIPFQDSLESSQEGTKTSDSSGYYPLMELVASFLRTSPLRRTRDTCVAEEDIVLDDELIYRELLLAQCRTRCARIVYGMSQDQHWAWQVVKNVELFSQVLEVAAVSYSFIRTLTLEDMENRAIVIQSRLRQMLSTPSGTDIIRSKVTEISSRNDRDLGVDYAGRRVNDDRNMPNGQHEVLAFTDVRSTEIGWRDGLRCSFCPEDDMSASGLVEHVLEKHSADMNKVPCPICVADKGDTTAHDLPTHLELLHFDSVLHDRHILTRAEFMPPDSCRYRVDAGRPGGEVPSDLVEQLMVIGFPEDWCVMALRENENDVVNASAWIVDNLDMLSTLHSLDSTPPVAGPSGNPHTSSGYRRSRVEGAGDVASSIRNAGEDDIGKGDNDGGGGEDDDNRDEEEGENDEDEEEDDIDEDEEDDDEGDEGGIFDSEDEDESKEEGHNDRPQPSFLAARQTTRISLDNQEADRDESGRLEEGFIAPLSIDNFFPLEEACSVSDGPSRSPHLQCSSPSRRADNLQLSAINAEIAGMELGQLTEAWLETEQSLTILYCRTAFVNMLLHWPASEPMSIASFGSPSHVLRLLQAMVYCGEDVPGHIVEGSRNALVRPFPNGAYPPKAIGVFAPFLLHLLEEEEKRPAIETSSDVVGVGGSLSGVGGSHESERLSALLTASCLDELDTIATSKSLTRTPWGSLVGFRGQSPHGSPKLELLQWLMDLLLSAGCTEMCSENAFSRLSNCLNSVNAAVKEVAMYTLACIAARWCEHLSSPCQGSSLENKKQLHTSGMPSPLAMEETLQRHVAITRIRSVLVKRMAAERRQGRLFFTRYSQTMATLYVAICQLNHLILRRRQHPGLGDPPSGIELGEPSQVTVLYCTETSVALAWSPVHLATSSSRIVYEIQMVGRQVGGLHLSNKSRCIYTGKRLRCKVEDLMPCQVYRFRLRALHPVAGTTNWSPVTIAETESGVAFRFDPSNSGPAIFVSGNELSASFGSNETWSTILGTTPFVCGNNYWELHIEKSSTAYLFIGVAKRGIDLATFLGGDENGWGFIGDRTLYHKRAKVKAYGERFGQGDTVGVTLNLDRGTLSFSKNGLDLGVAFEGLFGELYPAVAFYSQGQRVSLVRSAFRCPGAGITISGSPMSTTPEDLCTISETTSAMVAGTALPRHWVPEVFAAHMAWVSGNTTRYMTSCGYELQFDTSEAVCRPLGLKAKCRVRTPRGNATFVGMSNGAPWFHVDGEPGAWFFTPEEFAAGKSMGYYHVSSLNASSAEGGEGHVVGYVPGSEMGTTAGQGQGDHTRWGQRQAVVNRGRSNATEQRASQSEILPLSEERFLTMADCTCWTQAMDGFMVSALNDFADHHQVSVWNISPDQVVEIFSPATRRLILSGARSGSGVVEMSDEAVLCRCSVLKLFNHQLIGVLPLVDLGEGVQLSGKLESRTFCWGQPSASRGPALGGVGSPVRGLGPLVACLRQSIFLSTKKRILQEAVAITTTPAKKAEDEYDYPEGLPQVVVNRLEAVTGQESTDPNTSLEVSLFNQLYKELHSLDTSQLRMSYTHPMDDGQERTFKVKFEGEGVDDYGGPYREVFTQVAVELTTLARAPACKSGQLPLCIPSGEVCLLPILQPTRTSAGDDAEGGMEFTVCSGACVPHQLSMYNFLGKLMGIALRSRVSTPWSFSRMVWKGLVGEPAQEVDLEHLDFPAYTFIQRLYQLLRAPSGVMPMEGGGSLPQEVWHSMVGALADLSGDVGELAMDTGVQDDFSKVVKILAHARRIAENRLHQGDRALVALRDGFSSVVPAAVLPLFTWREMELQASGRPGVDIDLLEANTEYDEDVLPTDPHIRTFWRVLRSFNEVDRSQFLRFVWARSRLPVNVLDFRQKFKIQAPTGEGARDNPDHYLPKAHTCFFSINLPKYSSEEVMAEKLKYTMYNCIEMDADFRLGENEMMGWGNRHSTEGHR
ncbi:unnamed protein product [Discosporangium mesarthrocarpum]